MEQHGMRTTDCRDCRAWLRRLRRGGAAAVAAVLAAGCSERGGLLPAGAPRPAAALALECRADVRARTVACAPPGAESGARANIIGGQNVYLRLASSAVHYDSAAQLLSSDVTITNLTDRTLGSIDGSDATGLRVFFHSGPTVSEGSGTVAVANADSVGVFTSSGQPYFLYPQKLGPAETSAPRTWQFSLPPSVQSFTFSVFVQADVFPAWPLSGPAVSQWVAQPAPQGIYDVWVVNADTAWAANQARYAGGAWSAGTRTLGIGEGVWALDGTTAYSVGSYGIVLGPHGTTFSGADAVQLTGVAGTDSTDVWVVGDQGKIFHWNGVQWSRSSLATTQNLTDVWVVSPTEAYAVGWNGTVARWDGATWTVMPPPTTENLQGVWRSPAGRLYVVGWIGTIRRWADGKWETLPSGVTDNLQDVWGVSDTDVYAVGANGCILHWDGVAWTRQPTPTKALLNGISGAPGLVLVAGDNVLLRGYP
jgi:hypothetical protein